jgi:predicted SnoaL-like aldol condensation-catalyzing enzyme
MSSFMSAETKASPVQQVRELLKSIESGDPAPAAASINPTKYVQHNLGAADGLAGFAALMAQLPKGSARANTLRVFQDGAFVFAHTDYNFFGPKVGFDIFRFEHGKIVEHWDNLQDKPAAPNPSGHTMLDGPVEARDLGKTERNKKLAATFIEDVLMNGRMEKLAGYYDGDRYTQHNPQIADGLSGLSKALEGMSTQGITMKYDRVHKVLGEGNFVLTASEGHLGGAHVSFYDLFRIDNGKIAEHWDTIETIPAREQWKNANGKY